MTNLVRRSLVKELAQIARADHRRNAEIDGLIMSASSDVLRYCNREFDKKERQQFVTPIIQSYASRNPDQFIFLTSWPVDLSAPFVVEYDYYARWEGSQTTFVLNTDYRIDPDGGKLTLHSSVFTKHAFRSPNYDVINRGQLSNCVRVTFTGGYEVVATPEDPDPYDDYGYINTPDDMQMAIASKVAADLKEGKITEWTRPQYNAMGRYVRPRYEFKGY